MSDEEPARKRRRRMMVRNEWRGDIPSKWVAPQDLYEFCPTDQVFCNTEHRVCGIFYCTVPKSYLAKARKCRIR